MASTIVNLIIDRFLSEIVEIDSNKTKSSILYGNVELQGIKIKKSIFERLNLPYFEIVYGYVGKINIQMSLNIWSNPIKVEVNDIFILVRQKALDHLDESTEIMNMEQYKKAKLLSMEQIFAGVNEGVNNAPVQGGLIKNIINNIQVEIRNIVFRFEDSISCPKYPFAFGLILKKIFVKSSNQYFEDKELFVKFSDVNYKKLSIQGVNIFMDYSTSSNNISYKEHVISEQRNKHEDKKTFLGEEFEFYCYCMSEINTFANDEKYHYYLLYNWTTNLNSTMNEAPLQNRLPQIKLDFIISHFQTNLGVNHVTILCKLLSYISLNFHYHHGITKKFYNRNLSFEEKKLYVELYSKYYIEKYDKKVESKELVQILDKLEERLKYEQIEVLRRVANSGIESLKIGKIIEEIDTDIKSKSNQGNVGRLFNYLKSNTISVEELNKKKMEMQIKKEKTNNLLEAELKKDFVELREENQYQELGHQYMVYDITFRITHTKFTISEEKISNLMIFYFKEFVLQARIGNKWKLINIYLDEISANQYKTQNKYFTKLIESTTIDNVEGKDQKLIETNLKNSITRHLDNSIFSRPGALNIQFEINPELEKSNYSLKLLNKKKILVTLNHYAIQFTLNKFMNAIQNEFKMSDVKKIAKKEVALLIDEGYNLANQVIKGEYQHMNMEVDIVFHGPKFILPHNINDPKNSGCIMINLGLIETTSYLAPLKRDNIDYKTTKDIILIYDEYKTQMTGFELSTVEDYFAFRNENSEKSVLKLIQNVNVKIDFSNSNQPKNENFENIRMKLFVEDFIINLRDKQIEFIILFYSNFLTISANLTKELENIKKEQKSEKTDLSQFTKNQEKSTFMKAYQKTASIFFFKLAVIFKKDKNFLIVEFILTKFEFNIIKSLSEEEIQLREKNNLSNQIKFKEFLNFTTNYIKYSFSYSEKGNINFEANISGFSFYDNDNVLILNDFLEEDKSFLVNKEFRPIMGSLKDDININESRTESIYSDAMGSSIQIGNTNSFINLSYFYNFTKKKTKIALILNKFSVCFNFDTLLRIAKFGTFYSGFYNTAISISRNYIRNSIRNSSNSLNSQNEIKFDKPIDRVVKQIANSEIEINKNFMNIVRKKLNNRAASRNGSRVLIPENIKINTNSFIKEKDKIVLKQNLNKIDYNGKMKLSVEVKQIEFLLPLDHNEPDTKLLKFNYNIILKMKSSSESKCYYDDDVLVRQDYSKSEMEANLMILNWDFDILNFIDNKIINKSLRSEKIICNSRITIGYSSFLILEKESVISALNVHLEPITVSIGFRQIEVFQNFAQTSMKFREKLTNYLYGAYLDNIKSYKSMLKDQLVQLNEEINRKDMYNIYSFNNLFEVNLKIDKTRMRLIDNTSSCDLPMAKFEVSKISVNYITNTNPVDAHNMGIELIEIISGRDEKNYNVNNMYMYLNFCFHIEILFFNQKLSNWEPIMEPWNAELNVYQVAKMTRMKIFMTSYIMLNINLSHEMMIIFNSILFKLKQKKSDWVDDDENFIELQENHYRKNLKNAIEFKNNTGISIIAWFDIDPENKFEINAVEPKVITKNQLAVMEKKFNEAVGVLSKNHFSIRFEGFNTINNIDYSFNSTTIHPVFSDSQYVEINIHIHNNGFTKKISITSNVIICNNSKYSIALSIIKSKDIIKNTDSIENPSINFENAQSDIIKTNEVKKIPLNWLLEPHMVFGKLIQENFDFHKILISELNFVYQIGRDLNDKKDNETMKSYSKVISYLRDGRAVYLVLDILVLKSTFDENRGFYYYIVINPVFTVRNSIPYPIEIIKSGQKITVLNPLGNYNIYNLDIYDTSLNVKVSMKYINDSDIESEDFNLFCYLQQKSNQIKLYPQKINGRDPKITKKDYIVSNVKFDDLDCLKFTDLHQFKSEMFISKSKIMVFYVDFLVTNRMNKNIIIKEQSPNDNLPINMLNSVIHAKQINLFSLENPKQTKIHIKLDDTDWSTPFDITTHGIEGVVHLNHFKEEDRMKKYETSVASIITSSSKFNNSTILILEPRFLLLNKMPFDAFLRQSCRGNNNYFPLLKISSEESMMLSLNTIKYKGFKKIIQFSLSDEENKSDQSDWSSDINVDSLDDFNIKLKVPQGFDPEKYKVKNENILIVNKITYILAKLIVYTKDSGLIYLILLLPNFPQFLISNNISLDICAYQDNTKEIIEIPAGCETPYVWTDCIADKKRLVINYKDKKVKIAFEKIEKEKSIQINDKIINFAILLKNNNQTKVLKIFSDEKETQEEFIVKNMFFRKKLIKQTKIAVNLYGFGISIIDSTPKEMLYISFYKIDLNIRSHNLNKKNTIEKIINFTLLLKNFQIDYCLDGSFNSIVSPKLQMKPSEEESIAVQVIPFVQILLCYKITDNIKLEITNSKFSQIDIIMQEMNIKIDQSILNNVSSLIYSVIYVLDFNQIDSHKISEEAEQAKSPWEYDKILSIEIDKIENLNEACDEYDMIFIEHLFVSGMKLSITLRIDIESLNIQLLPGFLLKILSTLGNSIARISDAPLNFKEFVIPNCFSDTTKLRYLIMKHFTMQGIKQFYKILGSSDLLGNPVGLLENIGTGFLEFFNEPRKGFMQGPKEFGEGIAKGIASLIGNVVGGGLNSVSKITGTLYSAAKNVIGEKGIIEEDSEPSNIITGAFEGVKGGGMELIKGLTGIFTNPYDRAKKEGYTGFIKGMGAGLLGAILSPFAAALRLGNSMIVGLKNTVTMFQKGKIKTERFRFPRHITKNQPLNPYDENFAEIQAMIKIVVDISDKNIIYFYDFRYEDEMELYREMYSTMIITDHRVMICYGEKSLILSIELNKISNCQVHISPVNSKKFLLVFFLISNERKFIITPDKEMCCQVYSILRMIKNFK